MKKTSARRQAMVEKIADHLLEHGLQRTSLRPLARAAGTSDRMLLHYFVNKEDLLQAALHEVATRMMTLLDSTHLPPMPLHELLPALAGMLNDPRFHPYLRLYLELAALSAREAETYRPVAQPIARRFYDWLAAALHVEDEAERARLAALTFVTVEGWVFLEAIGEGAVIAQSVEVVGRAGYPTLGAT